MQSDTILSIVTSVPPCGEPTRLGWRDGVDTRSLSGRAGRHRVRLHEYDHDPAAESYGLEAAEKLGVDPARIFKTLVVSVDGELNVACVPVARRST